MNGKGGPRPVGGREHHNEEVCSLMRGSVNRWARGALIAAASVVACALSAAPADAKARCYGSFPNFLGYAYYRLDVTVYYHRNMTCGQAVQLGQRAYSLPGLRVIRDPYEPGRV